MNGSKSNAVQRCMHRERSRWILFLLLLCGPHPICFVAATSPDVAFSYEKKAEYGSSSRSTATGCSLVNHYAPGPALPEHDTCPIEPPTARRLVATALTCGAVLGFGSGSDRIARGHARFFSFTLRSIGVVYVATSL